MTLRNAFQRSPLFSVPTVVVTGVLGKVLLVQKYSLCGMYPRLFRVFMPSSHLVAPVLLYLRPGSLENHIKCVAG